MSGWNDPTHRNNINGTPTFSTDVSREHGQRKNVLVVEHVPLVRYALATLLANNSLISRIETVAQLSDLSPQASNVDIALVDVHLPGFTNVESILAAREQLGNASIVALAFAADKATILSALDAGAMGYLPKSLETGEIERALDVVLRGGVFVPPLMHRPAPNAHEFKRRASDKQFPTTKTLRRRSTDQTSIAIERLDFSERQKQVLSLLVRGMANKVICRELAISENTVKTHIATIFRTLGVKNRTEAVVAVAERYAPLPLAN